MSSPISETSRRLPAVDEHIVAGENGYEVDDGKLVRVPPALEPHANRHSKISALLEAHVAGDFDVASDMLTRLSEDDDRAPDASVYPRARDPVTGGRLIEQLAFEVVNTEKLGHAADKAAKLCARGVRRVFAIDVKSMRGLEWSHQLGTWQVLDPTGSIEDPALAVPLPLEALVGAARTDDTVARALLAKRNPVLMEAVAEAVAEAEAKGLAEGEAKGRAEALLHILLHRGLEVTTDHRHRILAERNVAQLDRWIERAFVCGSVDELVTTP